jgi:hypothetical protein
MTTPNDTIHLSAVELIALTLAFSGVSETKVGDAVPAVVWQRLYELGLVANARDATDEYHMQPTLKAADVLIAHIAGGIDADANFAHHRLVWIETAKKSDDQRAEALNDLEDVKQLLGEQTDRADDWQNRYNELNCRYVVKCTT